MTEILAVHSHGGGSGKSTFTVNLGTALARRGHHVCLVDTDIQAPGLHVLLGIEDQMVCSLSDYLLGRCEIEAAVYDATDPLTSDAGGKLSVVPSRLDAELIANVVGAGYDAGLLDEALQTIAQQLRPDVLILDTQSGMTNETMVALAAADAVLIMIRADQQDYRGAAVATAAANMLNCPRTAVVVAMTTAEGDLDAVRREAEECSGGPVDAVIPYLPEMTELNRGELMLGRDPEHPMFGELLKIAHLLLKLPAPRHAA